MRAARDQLVDLVIEALKAIPQFGGRVHRDVATTGWDERTYPAALVMSGDTRVERLSDHDGYEIQRRTTEISVDIGVREYADEDPIQELSALVVAVEDAMVTLEVEHPAFESVDVVASSGFVRVDDGAGSVTATQLDFLVNFYTHKGRSGTILAG